MQQKRTICCYICKNILGIAKHGREANFCDYWKLFEYADLHRQLPIPIGKRKMLARALARPLMTTAGEIPAFDKSLLLLALIRYIQTNQLCKPKSAPVDQPPIRAALDHLVPNNHPIFPFWLFNRFFSTAYRGSEIAKLSSNEKVTMYRCRI